MKKLLLLSVVFLAACSQQSDISDLQEFVATTTNKPKGRIQPLPEFKPYSAFVYSASALRSPFESPALFEELSRNVASNVNAPNANRPKQPLERYQLSELTLVGTLAKDADGLLKALIKTESGNVHVAQLGEYLGKNNGRIITINESKIEIVEVVPNGSGGWITRPQTLGLDQAAGGE